MFTVRFSVGKSHVTEAVRLCISAKVALILNANNIWHALLVANVVSTNGRLLWPTSATIDAGARLLLATGGTSDLWTGTATPSLRSFRVLISQVRIQRRIRQISLRAIRAFVIATAIRILGSSDSHSGPTMLILLLLILVLLIDSLLIHLHILLLIDRDAALPNQLLLRHRLLVVPSCSHSGCLNRFCACLA